MECLTKEVISDYFASLKEEMTKGNFMNSPNRIYNVNETGISLVSHPSGAESTFNTQSGLFLIITHQLKVVIALIVQVLIAFFTFLYFMGLIFIEL